MGTRAYVARALNNAQVVNYGSFEGMYDAVVEPWPRPSVLSGEITPNAGMVLANRRKPQVCSRSSFRAADRR